jgi:outer membrane immunogenic protein
MHRMLLGVALVALTAGQTMAADMPRARVVAPPPPAAYSWTGCYVGTYSGGASGVHTRFTDKGTPASSALGLGYNDGLNHTWSNGGGGSYMTGGTLGCNWQAVGSPFVWGVEGELGALNFKRKAADPTSPAFDTLGRTEVGNWDGIVAGRLGYAWDRVMIYVKGGVAFIKERTFVNDPCITAPCGAGSVVAVGNGNSSHWTAGGGLEWAFAGNWSVKGEYMLIAIDKTTTISGTILTGPATGTVASWVTHISALQTAKVGVNYRF